MVLHAENAVLGALQPLHRAVEQVDVRNGQPRPLKAVIVNGVAVILRGYLYLAREFIQYGVVAAPVAEFQLVCLCAVGKRYHLMTEAYAEERVFAPELFDRLNDGRYILGVARAV